MFRTLSSDELLDDFCPTPTEQPEAEDSSISDMTHTFMNSSLEESNRSFEQESNFELCRFVKNIQLTNKPPILETLNSVTYMPSNEITSKKFKKNFDESDQESDQEDGESVLDALMRRQ